MRRRVACASAVEDALALGDPDRCHVRLDPRGLQRWETGPQGDTVPTGPGRPWDEIVRLDLDAPAGTIRVPGVVSGLLTTGLNVLGFDHVPSTADFTLEVSTYDGCEPIECHGFLGWSYWRPHVSDLQALLAILVERPASRSWLADPRRLLSEVSALQHDKG